MTDDPIQRAERVLARHEGADVDALAIAISERPTGSKRAFDAVLTGGETAASTRQQLELVAVLMQALAEQHGASVDDVAGDAVKVSRAMDDAGAVGALEFEEVDGAE